MKKEKIGIIASLLFTLIFVLLVFTIANIDPMNTQWVTEGGGDYLQHYLGWRFFRESPWTRHFLFMQNWNYPVGTSVIVTDSNPLFCLFFKLFAKILPDTFQFNGIWILSSFLLNALFASLILTQITHNPWAVFAGSVIAVLNPVVLQRALIHDTLTAHWLILFAVYLFINEEKRWNVPCWFVLCGLTMLVHIYFLPMVLFVLVLQLIRMLTLKRPFRNLAAVCIAALLSICGCYVLLGYQYILPQTGSYGELSMNLNAFINPDGASSLLQDRPALPLQYEGFNYPGLGLIALILAAAVIGRRDFFCRALPYLIPCLLLIGLAASNQAYFDRTEVYSFALPETIYQTLSIFRSSGRLVWPLYYLALFYTVWILSEKSQTRGRLFIALLAVCALLQAVDLKDFIYDAGVRFRNPGNPAAELPAEVISAIPDGTEHVYLSCSDSKIKDAFALYAADHHLTMNQNTSARGIKRIFGRDPVYMDDLPCAALEPDAVYLYYQNPVPEETASCPGYTAETISSDWVLLKGK